MKNNNNDGNGFSMIPTSRVWKLLRKISQVENMMFSAISHCQPLKEPDMPSCIHRASISLSVNVLADSVMTLFIGIEWLWSRLEISGYEEYSGIEYRSSGCTEEYNVVK